MSYEQGVSPAISFASSYCLAILNDKVLIPALMRYFYGAKRYRLDRLSWITLIIIRVNVDNDNS